MRDPRIDEEWLRNGREIGRAAYPRTDARMRAGEHETGKPLSIAANTAKRHLRTVVEDVREAYALGDDLDLVRDLVLRASEERVRSFGIIKRYDPFNPSLLHNMFIGHPGPRAFQDIVDMLAWSILFDVRAVARTEMGLPPADRYGDQVIDDLASWAGASSGTGRYDIAVPKLFERWPSLVAAPEATRQAAFEEYVRTWDRRRDRIYGKRDDSGRGMVCMWSFEAAAFAFLFDVDDSNVRDVGDYPGELVDYRRAMRVKDAARAASFEAVREKLVTRLHGEEPLSVLRLELVEQGLESALPVAGPMAEDVLFGAAIETEDSFTEVTQDMLDSWGVDLKTVLTAARENAPRQLDGIRGNGDGTYLFTDDKLTTAVVSDARILDRLAVRGDPLLLPLARTKTYLTGSEDVKGLRTVARAANKVLDEGSAALISCELFAPQDIFLDPVRWPDSVAQDADVAMVPRKFRTQLYARQARALAPNGIPIAEAQLVRRPDGSPWTVATWIAGALMHLPKVDEYLIVREDGTVEPMLFATFWYNWGDQILIVGGSNPPLYEVHSQMVPEI